MFTMPALGAKLLWKIGAGFAVVATIVLAFFLVKAQLENRSLGKERDKLTKSINDPVTGYIARLTTAQNNVVILESAIKRQNSEFTRQSNAAKAEMERLRTQLRAAQAESAALQRRVNKIMGTPIAGQTLEQRVQSVDKMVLEDLKK